jgi:hypothetical protein
MSNSRYSSPYFRYLKARLWNLARPGFWGTAIFLSVVGLTIREFWMRPNIVTSRQSKPVATQPQANSTLSAEDRAIVADIDNLPILVYDSEQVAQPPIDIAEPISQPEKGNQNPLQEAIKNPKLPTNTNNASNTISTAPSIKYDNPFLTQANNLLQFGNPGNSSFVGLNNFNTSNQSNNTASGLKGENTKGNNSTQQLIAVSPLQTALQNQTGLIQTPLNQTTNRTQPITQSNNFYNSSGISSVNNINNINALPQYFTQPSVSPVNVSTFTQSNSTILQQPQTYYGNNGASLPQPQTYYGNNGASLPQPQTYNNLNNNSFNNIQPLPSNTITPQTISPVNTTVLPSAPNTVTYPAPTIATPSNVGNTTFANPNVQQPTQILQSPTSGQPIRY